MAQFGLCGARANVEIGAGPDVAVTIRVKLSLSASLLQKFSLEKHWSKFWFAIPPSSCLIADFLPLVWATMQLNEDPTVKLFCDGCYIPSQSIASILRDGDAIHVTLWNEDMQLATCRLGPFMLLTHSMHVHTC